MDYFDMTGPMAVRDMIMTIDLSDAKIIPTADQGQGIQVRLVSGFMFWELDYTGMDYSPDTSFRLVKLPVSRALNESGKDISKDLTGDDDLYYIQYSQGEEGNLDFNNTGSGIMGGRSRILHTKGYYEHVRDYPDPPDRKRLQTFGVPGTFSRFSFENWREYNTSQDLLLKTPGLP